MTAILGISAFYHDSAAALVVDGEIIAAAQEERFTRKKHDAGFPKHAIDYCLAEAGLSIEQLDHVGFYEKPLLKFERLLETYLSYAPAGLRSFAKAMPQWIGQKLHLRREIRRGLSDRYRGRFAFCEHHESHAASAFFPSPFDEAAILTLDGVGEWTTTSLGVGLGHRIELTDEIRFPHSLGLLYSAFTHYCGFRVNSGEYKLMGLAPYGSPQYSDLILRHLIEVREDGSFQLDLRYFNYCQGLTMTSSRFHQLFGRGPRKPEMPISQLDMDLAASVQEVTEQVVLKSAIHLHEKTKQRNLCMAGGVALNCVANGRLLREGPFENIWIQPAAGDAGGALGIALLIWHQLLGQPRPHLNSTSQLDRQHGSLLGPRFTESDILQSLDEHQAIYTRYDDAERLAGDVAQLLADGNVVGRVSGRMEFGPRALGNRSILGDPRSDEMQSVMNQKIKFRESFRPFAPVVLADHAADYFDIPHGHDSPYMLLVFNVAKSKWVESMSGMTETDGGLQRVNEVRSTIPAVTHVDHSARVQTVDAVRNPDFERLLRAFYDRTGCPVLINTSFNVRGEPIVCTPADAYRCFMATNMDVLVLENVVLKKAGQPRAAEYQAEEHLSQFELD
ncbi:carbamoyltransferase family protein [Stieleria varia]|uniref:Decarbamoylnovobiocin carbamoyltransferase n=1 Tax=Stieleria varia TaxID=2528005 RepID=A0A5C6A4P2_9BACT|nr:carbamoyltransferase [Stieleria varia]TWT94406.1 Decarbamoylnovobiocin carbamoyltransferase [Stieleria varia]